MKSIEYSLILVAILTVLMGAMTACAIFPKTKAERLCENRGGMRHEGHRLVLCHDGSAWKAKDNYYEEVNSGVTEL